MSNISICYFMKSDKGMIICNVVAGFPCNIQAKYKTHIILSSRQLIRGFLNFWWWYGVIYYKTYACVGIISIKNILKNRPATDY